ALQAGNIITADGAADTGFVFKGNVVAHNAYGIIGSGTAVGNSTLTRFFPQALVRDNVIVGGNPGQYPAGNFFPRSLDAVGFADPPRGDYRLADSSPYKRAGADGKGPGVDFDTLKTALSMGRPPAHLPLSSRMPRGGA
ncbi:MAG TPA: hypothetical protein VLM91_14845, partial [Candidatus Methylomirabilis sp.]|nr:hypothetical protein [Candidatus Methylomirabilis sp.]